MAKNGKAKTIIAIVTGALLVAVTWTTFILAGSDVKNTADGAKEAVIILKKDGCDPVHDVDKRCIVLETKWETIDTSQQRIEANQQIMMKALEK